MKPTLRQGGDKMADVRVTFAVGTNEIVALILSAASYGGQLLPASKSAAIKRVRKELVDAIDNKLCGASDHATEDDIKAVQTWVGQNFPEFQ